MKRYLLLIAVVFAIISFNSCEGDRFNEANNTTKILEGNTIQFCPTYEVKEEDGMLVFDSKIAFDVTLVEILNSDPEMVDDWYTSIGVETFYKVFNQVVEAEEAIETFLFSLPQPEQEYWKMQAEYHSDEYKKAIVDEILIASNEEGNSTYDYNLVDKTVATVVNKNRLVQIEGKIHQYNDNSILIVNKDDIDLLKSKKLEENEKVIVITKDDCKLKSVNSLYNWTQESLFREYGEGSRHRARFWIDGHSEMVIHQFSDGSWTNDHCSDYSLIGAVYSVPFV
jgi:hypothetical protein